MQIGLPLLCFESEGLEDSYRQYHEGGADETDANGFFVTFVHTAAKIRNKTDIHHISVLFIPEIWKDTTCNVLLHPEMFNINE